MKGVKFVGKFIAVLAIVWISSCKADEILNTCTTCTESSTSVSETYCGTVVEVQTFETTLQAGSGTWTCVRN